MPAGAIVFLAVCSAIMGAYFWVTWRTPPRIRKEIERFLEKLREQKGR